MEQLSPIYTYLKRRALYWAGYEQDATSDWERPRLVGCEIRAFHGDELYCKNLKLLPINETPKEYFANMCENVHCRASYYIPPYPDHVFHYLFDSEEIMHFPIQTLEDIRYRLTEHTERIQESFIWNKNEPYDPPMNVTETLVAWSGPVGDFHARHVPVNHIWPNMPAEGWNLFIMDNSGSTFQCALSKTTKIGWPFETEVTMENFLAVRQLSTMTRAQIEKQMETYEKEDKKNV